MILQLTLSVTACCFLLVVLPSTAAQNTRFCRERICTLDYSPVCGSDGVTYSNECGLRLANCDRLFLKKIKKVSDGECPTTTTTTPKPKPPTYAQNIRFCRERGCIFDLSPVCGSDGVTYSNECFLRLANCDRLFFRKIKKVSDGKCPSSTTTTPKPESDLLCKDRVCTADVAPVCGSDGVTYGNDCRLRLANCNRSLCDRIRKVRAGPCPTTTTTTTTSKPKCTPYPKIKPCNTVCIQIYKPVCGINGRTYENACSLEAENCPTYPCDQVFIAYSGECDKPDNI